MMKLIVFLTLAACGAADGPEALKGSFGDDSFEAERAVLELESSDAASAPAASGAQLTPQAPGDGRVSSATLDTAQRKVISMASISIEVELVSAAINEVGPPPRTLEGS
jgi:hypothetical protein